MTTWQPLLIAAATLGLTACTGATSPPGGGDDDPEPVACEARPVQAPGAAAFTDISAASGIQANNFVASERGIERSWNPSQIGAIRKSQRFPWSRPAWVSSPAVHFHS